MSGEWKEFALDSDTEYIKEKGFLCHGDYPGCHISDYDAAKGYQIAFPMEKEADGIGSTSGTFILPGSSAVLCSVNNSNEFNLKPGGINSPRTFNKVGHLCRGGSTDGMIGIVLL